MLNMVILMPPVSVCEDFSSSDSKRHAREAYLVERAPQAALVDTQSTLQRPARHITSTARLSATKPARRFWQIRTSKHHASVGT